jgi:rhodanese-related sulfurtransferase
MKLFDFSSWTLNQKLALGALLLGALAVAGDPYGGGKVEIDADELARIVQDEVDHVTAPQLADWILAGRTDFRVIDLREEAEYAAYHVPGAERVPITELADYPLYRNEPIVLYSDGGIHSAQGWFLLRAKGYAGASILLGGLDAWKDEVLFPVVAENLEPAVATRLREVAEHFGGQPRGAGAAEADASYEMPEVAMPVAPAAPPPSQKRKKKEGC